MATLCAISGELPQVPVVSRKSGNIYEKRLIEAYISENGTEPTTGASLTAEDLLDVQGAHVVRPRPPEFTSIPALLGAFQQEWDALALEVFTLQQNLTQTRQELSTVLYQHDAAVRVIARLTQERDAAREALQNVQVNGSVTNGDAMHIDSAPLPAAIAEKVDNTQVALSKTRRKRPVPAEWATSDTISLFKPISSIETPCVDTSFISIRKSDNLALVGSKQGGAYTLQPSSGQVTSVTPATESVTAGAWVGSRVAVGLANGKVKIVDNGEDVASFGAHSGSVTGLTVHPSGEILASVSSDGTYAIYDTVSNNLLTQVQASSGKFEHTMQNSALTDPEITCAAFHPDGHLLATGGKNGQLQIFEVKSGAVGGVFELGAPAKAMCFSENGTWLATAVEGSLTVSIWDLRKAGSAEGLVNTLEVEHDIESLDWDYTAQYLLVGGNKGLTVKQYTKSSKLWSEPLKVAVPALRAGWGDAAQSILSLANTGTANVLSSA